MLEHVAGKSPIAAVVRSAQEEARRRGDRRLGTEHLLLGLLHDPTSAPARALGVDVDTARAALDALDRAALAAIGVDLGDLPPASAAPSRTHPPVSLSTLTSSGRAALDTAVKATRLNTRHLAPSYLLLALLASQPPDPVAQLITQLGIDRSAVRHRLDQPGSSTGPLSRARTGPVPRTSRRRP
jgi:ATP-dependent Clp protease ATP-binding subunit ClpA